MVRGRNARVSDEQIISAIKERDRPYATASQLAEDLPLTRQGLGKRLRKLHEKGDLDRDKISGNAVLYLIRDES